MNVAGNAPGHGCLERVHIIYVCVCVCVSCVYYDLLWRKHTRCSVSRSRFCGDRPRHESVCAIIFIDIFPTWKKNFFFFFILLRAGLYYCYYCTMRWWWWWRSPPATPCPFFFPFSVYCRLLLLLLLSRRFLLLIKWLSGFHFSFWALYNTKSRCFAGWR